MSRIGAERGSAFNRLGWHWKRRVVEPFRGFSLRAMSPEAIALSVALGFVFGVFPVLGLPTLLCAVAAFLLRLNTPAIQAINYLVYPLQLALLAPFIRLGDLLFRGAPASAAARYHSLVAHTAAWRSAHSIGAAALHAVAAWFCVCAPIGLLLYFSLAFILRRYKARRPLLLEQ